MKLYMCIKQKKVENFSIKRLYIERATDKIYWAVNQDQIGVWLFCFDKEHIFNMFEDYPFN